MMCQWNKTFLSKSDRAFKANRPGHIIASTSFVSIDPSAQPADDVLDLFKQNKINQIHIKTTLLHMSPYIAKSISVFNLFVYEYTSDHILYILIENGDSLKLNVTSERMLF